MLKKILLVGLCILAMQGVLFAEAAGVKPKKCQLDEEYLLGVYAGNGEVLVISENGGNLNLLYRYLQEDNDFKRSNVFPLIKEHYDAYLLKEAGPMTNTENVVKFERDKQGHGISLQIGGHRYTRRFIGEKEPFRFKLDRSWEEINKAANMGEMPVQTAVNIADLTDLANIGGLKFDLRYATDNNCFGKAIASEAKAFLDLKAAKALERAQESLAQYGYGIVVWEAYRPWRVSKLAFEALPTTQKNLLPKPEEGFSHNTGLAIDVSLYDLASGEKIKMISDFDEPSAAQYAHFAGGSSLQRWQRDLLQEIMVGVGFQASDMEWWHFDYDSENKYQNLDVSLSNLD